MFVTYTPEGNAEGQRRWTFLPGRVRQSEAAAVEKAYGSNWDQFCAEAQAGSIRARRVLLWLLMRRDHPTLRLEDVPDFYTEELVVQHSADELRQVRERVEKSGLSEAERDMALGIIDGQIAEAEALALGPDDEGKATSNTEH